MTGGAQGLGFASARALLEHGISRLVIFDVDKDMCTRAVDALKATFIPHVFRKLSITSRTLDVSDEAAVNKAIDYYDREWEGIDILLCFAGITESKLAIEYPIDSWKQIFDVNVHGCFLVARAVAR